MVVSTVVVTGGNGKLGSATLRHLTEAGYEAINISRGPRDERVADRYLRADLLDAGEAYGALAKIEPDAIVHMGTVPIPDAHPEHVVYKSNTLSSMHVLEASQSLGVDAVCLASSINAMGAEHQQRDVDVRYLPVDEAHPLTPGDEYGIAKHAMEVTAAGYGRREYNELTISTIRFPWCPTTEEMHENFKNSDRGISGLKSAHPRSTSDVLFAYLHIDDVGSAVQQAIEADYDGHETFWVAAADTTADVPTGDLLEAFYPDADVRQSLDGFTSLVDTSKAERYLNWEPTRTWREN